MVKGKIVDRNLIINALKEKNGVVRHAALEIGCDPAVIFNHIHKGDQEIKAAREEGLERARVEKIDREAHFRVQLQDKYQEKIDSGDNASIIYGCKALLGWAENRPPQDDNNDYTKSASNQCK